MADGESKTAYGLLVIADELIAVEGVSKRVDFLAQLFGFQVNGGLLFATDVFPICSEK